jgi:hypothetical protein
MISDRRGGAVEQFAGRVRAGAHGVLRSWKSKLGDIPAILLLLLPFATVALITRFDFRLVGDEGIFSLRVIESFASTWPRPNLADYGVTSTPLAYVLLTGWGKIVGFEIWKLRSLTAGATFLAAYVFYRLCKGQRLPYPLLSAFSFLLFPYIFFLGFTIYPENFALLFGVGALYYYLMNGGSPGRMIKGSVLATLAIYCRQSYIVLPATLLGVDLVQRLRRGSASSDRWSYSRPLILAIPILMFIPFFVLWGGATPPMTRLGTPGDWFFALTPSHVNYILVFVGFYFAPMLFRSQTVALKRTGRYVWLVAFSLLAVYFAFPVQLNDAPDHSLVAGLVIHGLDLVGRLTRSGVGAATKLALWVMGLIIVLGEWSDRPWTEEKTWLVGVALSYTGFMIVTPFVYERYYEVLVPLLILIMHRTFHSRRVLGWWLPIQALVAAGFSYWQIALK